MAEKPVIRYEVRAQRDPINNTTVYVPAIVDRSATKSLTTVIENAIDRGLIVGIKASAASGSATYVSTPPLGNRRRLTSADFTPPAAHAPTCAAGKFRLPALAVS